MGSDGGVEYLASFDPDVFVSGSEVESFDVDCKPFLALRMIGCNRIFVNQSTSKLAVCAETS
jgi:hypothetical protein